MNWRIVLLAGTLLLPVQAARAAVSTFYLGTYTDHSDSQGIYLGSLDLATGRLGQLKLAATEKNPNFLALSMDHEFLFAALSDAVESFRVQPDGTLRALGRQPSGGGDTCHVSLDKTDREVFVSSYGAGNLTTFPAGADGRIGPRLALIPFTGSGPNHLRQDHAHIHSAYVDSENHFLYVCDLGTDSVWIFHLGPKGELTPASPPAAKVPPGSGPRHLAFSRDGRFVYVVNEMGVSVTVFTRDAETGALTPVETVPALPLGASKIGVTAAEIVLHPNGKWLYVSNRGYDTLSLFDVGADGRLRLEQTTSSVERVPRSFGIDPTGQWLISAGQKDNRIAVLRIDPKDGHLSDTGESALVGSPVCVLFVPDSMLTLLH